MNWREAFTVLDFETTGIDTDAARAIEVGVVRFDKGVVGEACNYLLNPFGDAKLAENPQLISDRITEVTGIKASDLHGQPTFEEVWPKVADLFEGAVVMAYNAPYDRRILAAEIHRVSAWPAAVLKAKHIHQIGAPWLDPLPFARRVDRYEKGGKSLVKCCERRGIFTGGAHRAVDDCHMAGELFLHFAERMSFSDDVFEPVDGQETIRVEETINTQEYKARKNGQSRLEGGVYQCDACNTTAWAKKASQPPQGWGRLADFVTCSVGCDVQVRAWKAQEAAV